MVAERAADFFEVMAPTGKGATLLVNALLSWRFSCIVVDPTCENASITAHFQNCRFGPLFILNPFGMFPEPPKGLKQARINPMDILDAASRSFHAGCDKLATALVWEEGREGIHFTTAARMLVSGVIAALVRHGAAHEKIWQRLRGSSAVTCSISAARSCKQQRTRS
jgi:type IV secretory pathway TraG/TraD family ATPase VirD4